MPDKQQPAIQKKSPPTVKGVFVLFLVSLIFTVLVIEVATHLVPNLIPQVVRIFFIDEDFEQWGVIADDYLGLKYSPGLDNFPTPFNADDGSRSSYPVSTVSLGYDGIGFRDDGITDAVGTVVVGDSFASCAGVKMADCWVEIAERQSHEDFANLGVISYGSQQIYRMLAKYGIPLKPRRILWVFYANDPYDSYLFSQFGKAGAKDGILWKNPIRSWLIEHSNTYKVSSFFWYNRAFFSRMAAADAETRAKKSNLLWWETMTDVDSPDVIAGLKLTQDAMLAAKRQIETQLPGTEFMVVIIPTREQLYYQDTALQRQLSALTKAMVVFGQQNNIPVINLAPDLQEDVNDAPFLYFKHDVHLNPVGNKKVADKLLQHLSEFPN